MTPVIKNEPLRLVLSGEERAHINGRLGLADRRLDVSFMVSVIGAGAILVGVTELVGWPAANSLLVIVGTLALLRSLIVAAEALFDIRKYRKYGDDLTAFLRRYNRPA